MYSPTFALIFLLLGCSTRPQPITFHYGDKVTTFHRFYGNGDCEVRDFSHQISPLFGGPGTYYLTVFCTFDTGFKGTLSVEEINVKKIN